MPSWGYVFALLIMPNLAIYLQGVRGDMCFCNSPTLRRVMTGPQCSARHSQLSEGACRKGQKSQTGKFMAPTVDQGRSGQGGGVTPPNNCSQSAFRASDGK